MLTREPRAMKHTAGSSRSAASVTGPGRLSLLLMASLLIPMATYAVIPEGDLRQVVNACSGTFSIAVAFWGLLRAGPARPPGWLLVVGGFAGWVIGDWMYMVEQSVLGVLAPPALSDLVYIASYVPMAAGLAVIVRRRGSRGDLAALLDAAILAAGTAVVVGVFVIVPIAGDSTLTLMGKVASSLYPIGDVLLLGILARLWTTPGARTTAFKLLAGGFAMVLFADAFYNYFALQGGAGHVGALVDDLLWQGSYVLIAWAAWSPSVRDRAGPHPGREDLSDPTKRMAVLTGGLLLPAFTLLGDTLNGGGVSGVLIATGSIALSILVLARMAGLLSVVSAQAVQLAALARSDALTGVPNRRTLDHELSRACQVARDDDTSLTVALLDLDRFKLYNDTFGHPAGDLLLREATAAWVSLLDDGEILARYGGEEFVVLFPGLSAVEARGRVLVLLQATPHGQTFSAGIATWNPATDPRSVLSSADIAMYNAKSQGRNRVCLAAEDDTPSEAARHEIVLQPIVDLITRELVAVEALSRFPDADPAAMFQAARLDGTWAELEAAAITAALAVRPADVVIAINVSLDGLGTAAVHDALSGDLTRVILEITENADIEHTEWLDDEVQSFRDRGAVLAVDDWGKGFSNLDRLLLLRPEIVKIDISLVHHLDLDYHQATIKTVVAWADLVGARICAEGVETEEQWHQLRAIGVHLGQGWFFGAPAAPGPAAGARPLATEISSI